MMFLRKNILNMLIVILSLSAFSCKSYISISKGFSSSGYYYYEEVYYFSKPEKMCEVIKEMRTEITQQGGIMKGNKKAGVFVNKNIQGSYRIIKKQFIFNIRYYNDFPAVQPNYRFTVTKPDNIIQAMQNFHGGIAKNNGTFEGNEQQGSFHVKSITGHYNITALVNIIIIDKPFGIPNSVIEKEIKNYFSGK
jgi:hypothetical protein